MPNFPRGLGVIDLRRDLIAAPPAVLPPGRGYNTFRQVKPPALGKTTTLNTFTPTARAAPRRGR